MIVSKDIIFIHIPKTAGTSITGCIKAEMDWRCDVRVQDQITGTVLPSAHVKASTIKRLVGAKAWNDAFVFAFVRHPLDLLVSFYFYGQRKRRGLEKNVFFSFEHFLCWVCGYVTQENVPGTGWQNARILQSEWLDAKVDFIGKVENIEADWDQLKLEFGFTHDLPHANKSYRPRHYLKYYKDHPKLEEMVREYFKEDFIRFGYK